VREELRAARSTPSEEFVSRLEHRIGADARRRRRPVVSRRPVLALAATLGAVVAAGVFGGISQAAWTVEGAVSSIVHVGQKARPHHAAKPGAAKPGAAKHGAATPAPPTPGAVASAGSNFGGGFAGPNGVTTPPQLPPPNSPVISQYVIGCVPLRFRGPYIKCVAP
jgi:hypothetical protein